MTQNQRNSIPIVKRARIILLVILLIFTALTSLLWLRPWYSPENKKTINVGYLPIYVDLPLFVAVHEGFFSANDIEVKMIRFQSSPDMAAAFLSNKIDAIASIATSSILSLESRDSGRFKIFLVDAETPENPLSSLLISSSSKIAKPEELKNKIIGSFPGPTATLFTPIALSNYGLSEDDYIIQQMDISNHIVALETGKIDALVTYEPTATQAEIKYKSKKLVSGFIEKNVINPWQAGIWVINSDYVQENGENTKKFINAIYDGVDFLRNNPERAKESLIPYTTIELEIAKKTPNIPFTKINEIDQITLQKHADMLTRKGVLSKNITMSSLVLDQLLIY